MATFLPVIETGSFSPEVTCSIGNTRLSGGWRQRVRAVITKGSALELRRALTTWRPLEYRAQAHYFPVLPKRNAALVLSQPCTERLQLGIERPGHIDIA